MKSIPVLKNFTCKTGNRPFSLLKKRQLIIQPLKKRSTDHLAFKKGFQTDHPAFEKKVRQTTQPLKKGQKKSTDHLAFEKKRFSDHPAFEKKKERQTTQPLKTRFPDHPAFEKRCSDFLVCHHSMASLDFWLRPNQSRRKVAAAAKGTEPCCGMLGVFFNVWDVLVFSCLNV